MILPSETNTKDIRHEITDHKSFDVAKIDELDLGDFFDDEHY